MLAHTPLLAPSLSLLVVGLPLARRVRLEVGVQDVLPGRSVLTVGTLERLLPRVGLDVHGERPLAGGAVTAVEAGEGLLPAVGAEVYLHTVGAGGGVRAVGTLV